jgi:hypothetical protein
MSERADKIYTTDISYGDISIRRGHWSDRLPEIDHDVAALEKYFGDISMQQPSSGKATLQAPKVSPRPTIVAEHVVPDTFHPGTDLHLTVTASVIVTESILWYRHVNQGERWYSVQMNQSGDAHSAFIPGSYTNSAYPLQYYFEFHTADAATLHPPFNPTLSNQPYYAIMTREIPHI